MSGAHLTLLPLAFWHSSHHL